MGLGITVVVGACLVGVSIGLAGIGGVFLIPLLVATGVSQEVAIGTSLVTFTATALIGTALFARGGRIDWRAAALTSAGSVAGGPLGAKLSVMLPAVAVAACFAVFLIGTGASTLAVAAGERDRTALLGVGWPALVACGLAVGIGSGLTGVGGPAILVPLLLLLRFPASLAIGISQPNAIASSASGALGHLLFGRIDWPLACMLSAIAGSGVVLGALLHGRFGARSIRKIVGASCIGLGLWLGGELLHRLRT